LLETPRRGYFNITKEGIKVLKYKPKKINIRFLEGFPGFKEFREREREGRGKAKLKIEEEFMDTPVEALENAYLRIRGDLALEIMTQTKQCSPKFFEKLVVELLLKMGYGGAITDAGKAIGQTADGGIDGIIKEDKLGLDVIYLQAKKWENPVGSGEVRNFVGSLAGHKANKGVFITTSNFAKNVFEYVKTLQYKVILIDGEKLAQLMIDYDVGVSKVTGYDVKKIDTDYFVEE
jgi:restriction system protein